jgi:hypothetical protein
MKRLACSTVCLLAASILWIGGSVVLLAPRAASAAETAAQAAEAQSDSAEPEQSPPAGEDAPTLGLDRLLQPRFELPDMPAKSPARDCNAWAARFDDARAEIEALEQQISLTREQVAAKSQGAYQYSPLGGETTSDPEVTKLRAQLKRDRESLEASEKRLRELFVEADLAGVPRSCTEPRS